MSVTRNCAGDPSRSTVTARIRETDPNAPNSSGKLAVDRPDLRSQAATAAETASSAARAIAAPDRADCCDVAGQVSDHRASP
jgi:hypothetical protein